ncbi:MAG: DNA mismatch repair endonuclease MutL [Clostridia bacterium]|nr:DNA mismatch repair endonuclease MutL [Clostridia bacterium]
MSKINILDKYTAELIAAGEVVERPASAIKELCENAIDAGATNITVEINHGGITYMRVTDNGCGIEREDIRKAFLRHATSKVKSAEDLDSIGTLGFRGEALASICAVSKVELITKSVDEQIGSSYCIEGGEEKSFEDAGCPNGTTIIVRDLFYNVPARMKFLKKDVAEGNAVSSIIDKIALSHPEVGITFIRDGRKSICTSGDGKLLSAIYGVFGKEFARELIPMSYKMYGIEISGYISKPIHARPTRNLQNFFLNGRFVKSRTAMAALEEAFKGSVMVGKYPSCVLNITMNCGTYDVNVHPAKMEVRFTNERPLFDCIYHGVKTALIEGDTAKRFEMNKSLPDNYAFKFISKRAKKMTSEPVVESRILPVKEDTAEEPEIFVPKKTAIRENENIALNDVADRMPYSADVVSDEYIRQPMPVNTDRRTSQPITNNQTKATPPSSQQNIDDKKPNLYEFNTSVSSRFEMQSSDKKKNAEAPVISHNVSASRFVATMPTSNESSFQFQMDSIKPRLRFIGEAFNTYIILQSKEDELMLVDKHAAHERLIYERLKRERDTFAQILLYPVIINLSKEEHNTIIECRDILYKAGYEIDDFDQGRVIVRAAPHYLDETEITDSVIELASYLMDNKNHTLSEKADNILHSTACRAAIKGGNISATQELIALVQMLEDNPDLKYCPHGRPISTTIKKRDIEKQFGRIQ